MASTIPNTTTPRIYLGDPELPANFPNDGWFAQKTERPPLLVLATTRQQHIYVTQLSLYNFTPARAKKFTLQTFRVHEDEGIFSSAWTVEKLERGGAASFAEVAAGGTSGTGADGQVTEGSGGMVTVDVKPPLLVRRGLCVGIWDQTAGGVEIM